MKLSSVVLAMALLLGVSSCTHYHLDLRDASMLEKASSNAIALKVKDSLTIVIDENPSTGYQWILSEPSKQTSVFEVKDDQFIQEE